MVVRVRTMQTNKTAPALSVFDAAGLPLQTQVLANDGASVALQVLGVRRGADYFVRVAAPAGGADATGNYRLVAGFQRPDAAVLAKLQSGQVGGASTSPTGGTLVIQTPRLFQFSFLTGTADGSAGVPVTVTIRDAAGKVVFALTQTAGQLAATGAAYLGVGTYTVTITASGTAAPPTNYWLYAGVASDPIDPYPSTTTTVTTDTTVAAPVPTTSLDTWWYGGVTLTYNFTMVGYFYGF